MVCEMVGGIQKAEGGMIEYGGEKIGSPHPLLVPLPFSWLALFGHVASSIAGGQREKGGRMDRLFFFFFSSQREESLMGRRLTLRGKLSM